MLSMLLHLHKMHYSCTRSLRRWQFKRVYPDTVYPISYFITAHGIAYRALGLLRRPPFSSYSFLSFFFGTKRDQLCGHQRSNSTLIFRRRKTDSPRPRRLNASYVPTNRESKKKAKKKNKQQTRSAPGRTSRRCRQKTKTKKNPIEPTRRKVRSREKK